MSDRDEHRPTFGWLTRRPDPRRPLDGAYVQRSWTRLYRIGPWRAAAAAVLVAVVSAVAFLTLISTGAAVGLFSRLLVLAVGGALLGVCFWFTLRVLTAGVDVTDDAVRVSGLLRSSTHPWTEVVDVRRVPGRDRLLGVLWPAAATRVVMVRRDGSDVPTPITTVSADFLGRPEAFDVAALALDRWWQDSQRAS